MRALAHLDPARPVLLGRDGLVSWGSLCRRAAGLAARIRQTGLERIGLGFADAEGFAAGLLAAASAGVVAVIPANPLPATLAGLGSPVMDDTWIAEDDGGVLEMAADLVMEFQTSGSTGAPKPVMRRLVQFEAEARALDDLWGRQVAGGTVWATVPHHHVYGMTFRIVWPLLSGRVFAARTLEMWEDVLAVLGAGDTLVTGPAHLSRMGGLGPLAPDRAPAMVLSAGAPLGDQAAAQASRLLGRPVTEIFGSSEAGAIASRYRDHPDPVWRVLPGVTADVSADGCLVVASPWAEAGETQDRALAVAGGGLRLLGRADRIAKIEGKRIHLDGIEAELAGHPWLADAAVLDLPGQGGLAAVVVPGGQGQAELARLGEFRFSRCLRAYLARRTEAAALPRRWRIMDSICENAMGKRSRTDLAALFEPPKHPRILASEITGDQARHDLEIPADLYWFQGHFPDFAVLPGVVLVHWAWDLARQSFGLGDPSPPGFQVKFKSPIRPGDHVTLILRRQPAKTRISFDAVRNSASVGGGSFSLGTP